MSDNKYNNKTVIVGVTGSIAAYKIADLVSTLVKKGVDTYVIMTKNATNFINPITFETLTNHKCLVDTFDRNFNYNIEHVSLAQKADAFLVAPASANVIGKIAGGIANDMLTTTIMAAGCKKLIAPAMNTGMYESEILQDNLEKLKKYGYEIIEPDEGRLACGVSGKGRLPLTDVLLEHLLFTIEDKKDLSGKKVLVTAGPTKESIDPVRYITNHSTGKMGYAIARAAMRRGAEVTLISGTTDLPDPIKTNVIHIESAEEMFNAVKDHADSDIIIKSAAVADYTPTDTSDKKIKKEDGVPAIELKPTTDILAWLGENKKPGQFICGFAMETEDLVENARKKLEKKNADMIVANNLRTEGAGFAGDTNVITMITANNVRELPIMTKEQDADEILDMITSYSIPELTIH